MAARLWRLEVQGPRVHGVAHLRAVVLENLLHASSVCGT